MEKKPESWSPLRALRRRIERTKRPDSLPEMPSEIYLAEPIKRINWKRLGLLFLGAVVFLAIYFSPPWNTAVDPAGRQFVLTREGKAALALFGAATIWWVFEVIPIGVTGIAVGVLQILFLIRPAGTALGDFMDPGVWFIIGSLIMGKALTKTGLIQRLIYKTLAFIGEKTVMITLGAFVMTGLLALIMAHTAATAAIFPLLMAIHSVYDDSGKETRFGKGLFIGMAYAAGAGSIVSMLGSGRAPVALSIFKNIAGREISFFGLIYYMFPLSMAMILCIWLFLTIVFPPEKKVMQGLRNRLVSLGSRMGKITSREKKTLVIVFLSILAMGLKSFAPALLLIDNSALIMAATVLFFVFNIIDIKDLEEIPWNIVLLFGGAASMGFCLWQTGAANWIAVSLVGIFQGAPQILFILAAVIFVLITTNIILNIAILAFFLPVGIVVAAYLGLSPEIILFVSLAAAGMPFMFLIGAAPNAIAYESRQFSPTAFFFTGIPMSIALIVLIAIFSSFIWPLMGMPFGRP
jgi:sodium-dependent dicarboxylate transporter 2/3/5